MVTSEPVTEIDSKLLIHADALGPPGEDLRWVMSFDGSQQEVAVRDAFPSTRIGYLQVAGVLVHLDEMLGQARQRLVDPAVIRAATRESLLPIVMQGSNVCRADMATVRNSWRAEIYEVFRDYRIEDEPLLDVLLMLARLSERHSRDGSVVLARCSADEYCGARDIVVPTEGGICAVCTGRLFPTDALRVHEEVAEEHENATALGRLMTTLEQLTMVAYLSYLLTRQPRTLGVVGFVFDGPLALFGPQAWLHGPILNFILTAQQRLGRDNLHPPVIVGIEKSGQFAEHAAAIGPHIPRRHVMALPDDYVYRHILTFRPAPGAAFGRDTYYGQKFFYRTARGQLLTITVPKVSDARASSSDPAAYPMLPATLRLLDRIGTALYEDAVIPVALAHSYAAIPLRTGTRVLTLLSRELLGRVGGS
ncbi:MAG: hypothetical protein ACRDJE_04550 [Dehalococcoidia bacterium]